MRYLLDTDICIYFLKGNKTVVDMISSLDGNDISISLITLAELQFGAYNSQRIQQNLERVAFFTSSLATLPLTADITDMYARIKATLSKAGNPVDDFDILIGATAIVNGLVLVTNNEQHYSRIAGIALENWTK